MIPESRVGIRPELDRLYDESYGLLGTDPRKAVSVADELFSKSAAAGYARGMALSRYTAGFAHFNLGDYSRAIEIYTEGDSIASASGLEDVAIKFRNGFGVVYFHLGRLKDSIEQYKAGLESARRLGLKRDLGNLLINLSINYLKVGNVPQALELLDEAKIIAKSYKSDLFTLYTYFNYAEALQRAGKTAEAEAAFSLCLDLAVKNGRSINQVETLVRLGAIRASRGDEAKGLAMIGEALAIGEKAGYLRETVEALLAAAAIKSRLGQAERAQRLSARAVEIAESRSIISLLPEALESRAAAESASGRHEEAYKSILRSAEVRRTQQAVESSRLMAELETVYRLEAVKKEAQLERQQRESFQSANERLALVTRIGKSLAASLKPIEILTRLWEGLSPAVDMSALGLGILASDSRVIEFSSWIENGSYVAPGAIPIGNEASFAARCVREGKLLYFRAASEWEAALNGKVPFRLREYGNPESLLYLPLARDDKVMGVMSLQSQKRDAYPPDEIEMIAAISAFACIAADNSVILAKLDAINRVVQDEKEAIEKVALNNSWKAEHDTLTGLPNRVLLDKMLEGLSTSHAEESLIGIIYLDLDGFKDVNDRYGHDAGDRTLIQVAERLKAVLRSGDRIARIGGDEFVVVAPGIKSRQNLPRIMEKLAEGFSEPIRLDEGDMDIRFSAGVALFPLDGREFKNLIRYADEAMYRVKRGSKNGWSFWSDSDCAE